jgi:hypothetical protein
VVNPRDEVNGLMQRRTALTKPKKICARAQPSFKRLQLAAPVTRPLGDLSQARVWSDR